MVNADAPGPPGPSHLVWWERRLPLGLGLAAFVLYVVTAAPGLYWLDSGELTAASFNLGVAHPPGFPIHTLLGKAFCLVPLGSAAFRVVLLSAALAAVAVGFAVALGARLTRCAGVEAGPIAGVVGGASAGLLLAVGHTFWRQATVAEVYSLAAALALGSLWLLLRIREATPRDPRPVLLLALVAGLATFGAHPTYRLLVLPPLLVAWLWSLRGGGRHTRAVPVLFGLGALVVLYLVAVAGSGRLPDWAHATELGGLWEHVMASRIRQADFAPLMLSGQGDVVGAHLRTAWEVILAPFVGIALPLGMVGAWRLLAAGGAARLLGAALLWAGVGDFVYSFWLNPMGLEDLQNGITAVVSLAVLSGVGLAVVATWIGHRSPRLVPAVAIALGVIAALPPLLDALPEKWSGADRGPAAWVDAALEQAPPRAVVLTESDDLSAGLLFAQQVEGARPDVLALVRQHLWVGHDLAARLAADGDPRLPWRDLKEYLGRSRQGRIQGRLNLLTLLLEAARRYRPVLWEPGDGLDRPALQVALRPGVPLFGLPSPRVGAGVPPAVPRPATASPGAASPGAASPGAAAAGPSPSAGPLPDPAALVTRLRRVLEGDEGELAARVRARHLNALGIEYLRLRTDPAVLGVAEQLFALARRAWPPSVTARVNGGVVLARRADLAQKAGRRAEAERLLGRAVTITEEALATAPNRYTALVNAGRFRLRLAELAQDPDGAAARRQEARASAHFRRAVRLHPDRAAPHFNLGVIAARRKRFAEAREHFRAALARDPRSQVTRLYLQRVMRALQERAPR